MNHLKFTFHFFTEIGSVTGILFLKLRASHAHITQEHNVFLQASKHVGTRQENVVSAHTHTGQTPTPKHTGTRTHVHTHVHTHSLFFSLTLLPFRIGDMFHTVDVKCGRIIDFANAIFG